MFVNYLALLAYIVQRFSNTISYTIHASVPQSVRSIRSKHDTSVLMMMIDEHDGMGGRRRSEPGGGA